MTHSPQRVEEAGALGVGKTPPQRVGGVALKRVDNSMTPSSSPTAPRTLKELLADDGVVFEYWGYHWLVSKQDFGVVGLTLGNAIRTVQDI